MNRGRRQIVASVALVALTAPLAARGQSAAPPLVGFLRSTTAAESGELVAALRRGLEEQGLVGERDFAIEPRYADNRPDKLAALTADLIDRRAAAIVGNAQAALAAKAVTTTIPIVFVSGEDPIRLGLVASLTRPEGNLTGVALLDSDLAAKRFGMLHEMTPRLVTIAVLIDPRTPGSDTELKSVEEASRTLERRILVVKVTNDPEIDAAFEATSRAGALATFLGGGPLLNSRRERLAALAVRHRTTAISGFRSFAEAGGLMSYGPNLADAYRRAGAYVARILRGAKPGDLPVELPTKFELVINLRAAKAIGFDMPPFLLTTADEVIE